MGTYLAAFNSIAFKNVLPEKTRNWLYLGNWIIHWARRSFCLIFFWGFCLPKAVGKKSCALQKFPGSHLLPEMKLAAFLALGGGSWINASLHSLRGLVFFSLVFFLNQFSSFFSSGHMALWEPGWGWVGNICIMYIYHPPNKENTWKKAFLKRKVAFPNHHFFRGKFIVNTSGAAVACFFWT